MTDRTTAPQSDSTHAGRAACHRPPAMRDEADPLFGFLADSSGTFGVPEGRRWRSFIGRASVLMSTLTPAGDGGSFRLKASEL